MRMAVVEVLLRLLAHLHTASSLGSVQGQVRPSSAWIGLLIHGQAKGWLFGSQTWAVEHRHAGVRPECAQTGTVHCKVSLNIVEVSCTPTCQVLDDVTQQLAGNLQNADDRLWALTLGAAGKRTGVFARPMTPSSP
jgi:hypothetical protein